LDLYVQLHNDFTMLKSWFWVQKIQSTRGDIRILMFRVFTNIDSCFSLVFFLFLHWLSSFFLVSFVFSSFLGLFETPTILTESSCYCWSCSRNWVCWLMYAIDLYSHHLVETGPQFLLSVWPCVRVGFPLSAVLWYVFKSEFLIMGCLSILLNYKHGEFIRIFMKISSSI
jgi:hypothetical protein